MGCLKLRYGENENHFRGEAGLIFGKADRGVNTWVVDSEGKVTKVGSESGIEDVVSDAEAGKDKGYYIIAGSDTTKYKWGDELVYIKHKSKAKLTVGSEKDTLKLADLKWEIDGKEACKGKAECEADLSKDGNYKIEVFAGADKVLKLNLDVYKKPVVKFERDGNYKGEYGFDAANQAELQSAKDYDSHKFQVEGTDYYTPWLTFRNGQTIILDYKVDDLEKLAQKDKEFEITFKSSSANVTIDGAQEIKLNYNTANSKNNTLIIAAGSGSSSFSSPTIITATDHKGDEIGKLAVVHGNVEPAQELEIVFVKVKHNKKYPTFNESNATFKLNEQSYNQFFRKWVNKTTTADTLDISTHYKANKKAFQTSDGARNEISAQYLTQKQVDVSGLKSGKKYYVFVTDISISKTDKNGNPGKVAGIAGGIESKYCILYYDRGASTVVHELGHDLGFYHTFDAQTGSRKIPEKTTESYMDYSTIRNMFFLYQMKKIK